MERLHPSKRQVAFALRVFALTCLAGCSNQQMSASNPFLAPDRVPPPATRTIAPGAAAPYYPGDPVPAAQNATPAAPLVAKTQAEVGLGSSAAPPAPTAGAPPQPLEFANERSVAIPSDDEKLRFALPSSPPIEQTQQPVIPAAYNQPVALQPAPAAALVPAATTDNNSSGPWRPPQLPNPTSPAVQAQYVQPQPQLTPTAPSPPTAPTMTPVGPTMTPPPRMRFPSWMSPSTWFTPQPAGNQQLIGYMVPGPNGAMQMVSVDEMQAMSAGTAQPTATVADSDGFRPRGSATK
jgi:hypothetical protein